MFYLYGENYDRKKPTYTKTEKKKIIKIFDNLKYWWPKLSTARLMDNKLSITKIFDNLKYRKPKLSIGKIVDNKCYWYLKLYITKNIDS